MKRVILFLTIFLSLFMLQQNVSAETIKFVQVTDVHLNQYNIEYLNNFVKEINKEKDLDFVVFTGDNIDNPDFNDLESFLIQAKKIKVKTYILLGNHDVFRYKNLDKKLYMHTVKKYMGAYHSNKPNYYFIKKGVVFVVMDGVKEVIPAPNGYYRNYELEWLESILNKFADKKVVILQHFPLIETNIDGHNTYNKDSYLELLKRHNNVLAVISGHYHKNKEVKMDNIYHIVTKNFSNNKYYKIIEIDTDTNMIYTLLKENTDEPF